MLAGGEMSHQKTIDAIVAHVTGSDGAKALFLSGSHAKGTGDAWSDIDFVLVAEPGPSDAIAAIWREAVLTWAEIVLWRDRIVRPMLINAITADWTRIDVVILTLAQFQNQTQDQVKPLWDPDDLYGSLSPRSTVQPASPDRFAYDVDEFLRIFGLLHLVVGREEYLNGVLGLFYLRNLLVDLLVAETGVPDRGGILHLNRLITAEQKELLHSLPPLVAEKEALIEAYLAYAAVYLPQAKARCADLGVPWPDAFEEATWTRLARDVGVDRPD